jgi:hypothetical protein
MYPKNRQARRPLADTLYIGVRARAHDQNHQAVDVAREILASVCRMAAVNGYI